MLPFIFKDNEHFEYIMSVLQLEQLQLKNSVNKLYS